MFANVRGHQHIFYGSKHRKQPHWPQQTSMLSTIKHKCFEYLVGDYYQSDKDVSVTFNSTCVLLVSVCVFSFHWFYRSHIQKKYFAEIFIFVKCCISNHFPFVDFQVHQETWSLLNCVIVFVTSFFVVNLNLSFISKGHEDSSLASFTIVFDKWSELRWLWFCHR